MTHLPPEKWRLAIEYAHYLEAVQQQAPHEQAVHLRFATLGTNAMFLANQLRNHAAIGLRTVIRYGAYAADARLLGEYNDRYGRQVSAVPWVLQRDGENEGNMQPWRIWFKHINRPDQTRTIDSIGRQRRLCATLANGCNRGDKELLELSLCLAYLLRFNPTWERRLEEARVVPRAAKAIAVHIRRGDACSPDLEHRDPNRNHFPLRDYIRAIDLLVEKHGYDHCFVMSESQQDIDRLRTHYAGRLEVSATAIDRQKFVRLQAGMTKFDFVEYRCLHDPSFTRFLNESALLDLHNVRSCQGMVGTFTSQFSLMSYAYMCGTHQALVPCHNLSPGSYERILIGLPDTSRKRLYLRLITRKAVAGLRRLATRLPAVHRRLDLERRARVAQRLDRARMDWSPLLEDPRTVLVVKERDVGFFSLFLQVVNILAYVHRKKLGCAVCVDLGDQQAYYDGRNTWTQHFGPCSGREVPIELLTEVRLAHQAAAARGDMAVVDECGTIHRVNRNCVWTNSYYPRFSDDAHRYYTAHNEPPDARQRREVAAVIREWVRPVPAAREFQESFVSRHFAGKFVVGVQFRGTDARADKRRSVPQYSEVFAAVARVLGRAREGGHERLALFVASDEEAFVSAMVKEFDGLEVLRTDACRQQEGSGSVAKAGPMGWGLPAFVVDDAQAALEGVIRDYLLLCRTQVLVHTLGSVSHAVLLTEPDIESVLVGGVLQESRMPRWFSSAHRTPDEPQPE